MKLDKLDIKILAALQQDGRMTKTRLGELVGLSPSPCHERIKRLEAAGYIRGYHAEIDVDRLVRPTLILVEIVLRTHDAADFERFSRFVADVPEVLECYQTSGAVDFILKVITRDLAAYQALMDRLLDANVGIGRYTTCVVTKQVKKNGAYPLDLLLG
ncbi:MAG: Lrp/AsnC family transcriptional regulator [Alphaproteobacteria bacterium]|nr:MAG: Lrp/AsnC family transcriptional regulator [Alphaproteobacteria bacterium]